MKPDTKYISCLVRLWREETVADEQESPTWQGEILHIQTGQKWPLAGLGEVQAVLKAAMEDQ